jgi:hypothetical protein
MVLGVLTGEGLWKMRFLCFLIRSRAIEARVVPIGRAPRVSGLSEGKPGNPMIFGVTLLRLQVNVLRLERRFSLVL